MSYSWIGSRITLRMPVNGRKPGKNSVFMNCLPTFQITCNQEYLIFHSLLKKDKWYATKVANCHIHMDNAACVVFSKVLTTPYFGGSDIAHGVNTKSCQWEPFRLHCSTESHSHRPELAASEMMAINFSPSMNLCFSVRFSISNGTS